jgi:hypothetical protein
MTRFVCPSTGNDPRCEDESVARRLRRSLMLAYGTSWTCRRRVSALPVRGVSF